MIKKSLYIMAVLLFSAVQINTMQVEAMQIDEEYWDNQEYNERTQILDKISNLLGDFRLGNIVKEKILSNISTMDQDTLNYYLYDVLKKLQYQLKYSDEKEITENILHNISKMDKDTLSNIYKVIESIEFGFGEFNKNKFSSLYNVLDKLPSEKITKDILFNISEKINDEDTNINDEDTLDCLSDILDELKELQELSQVEITTKILSNISKMNNSELFHLSCVINGLQESSPNKITKDILENISSMNKYELSWISYTFDELQLNEISKEILLNIIENGNNISTLKDINSVLSNLQKCGLIKNDLFINIMNNISKIDENILSNIEKMNADQLYYLYDVLNKLPSDKITTEILLNISKMDRDTLSNVSRMDVDELLNLFKVLKDLPSDKITTKVLRIIINNTKLLNIYKMNVDKLYSLCNVLDKLPLNKITTEVLDNISSMDKDTLNNLYKVLGKLPSEEITKDILTNISKINNKYALDWIYNVLCILSEAGKTKDILLKISTSKINDIKTLIKTKSIFSNLQGDGKPGDLFFKICKNIGNMHEDKLYALSKVLDKIQEVEITEDVLFNITKIDKNELFKIYNIFSLLPKSAQTEKILLNISKINNGNTLYIIHYILERFNILQLNNITEEILFNIINMNRYALNLIGYIFNEICNLNKSQLNKIKKETLLNIIKYIINEKDNISTLKDIESVLSNLPEKEGIKNLFINIRNNISEMDKDALAKIEANINKNNNVDNLDVICDIFNKISPDKITPGILTRISNMNCGYKRLYFLSKVLDILPEECKTEAILINIIDMNKDKLELLHDIFHKLPEVGRTKAILFNISIMNDEDILRDLCRLLIKLPEECKIEAILLNLSKMNKDTLHNIRNNLEDAKDDTAKMQVLRKFGVVPEEENAE